MKPPDSSTKAIIFDSGTLINFAINGLLTEFRGLKGIFGGKFLITKEVKEEVIDKPYQIKRFKLEALKIKELLTEGIIEVPSVLGIQDADISKLMTEIKNIANNTFFGKENAIQIVSSAEISCMALSKLLDEKGIKNVLSVDERTTRILGEKPENLMAIFQRKLHTTVKAKRENFKFFKDFKFIRSTELIYVAYKRGIIKLKNHDVLDALLYALKMNGCSISDEEIDEMKKLG
jgi:hypothetical protein